MNNIPNIQTMTKAEILKRRDALGSREDVKAARKVLSDVFDERMALTNQLTVLVAQEQRKYKEKRQNEWIESNHFSEHLGFDTATFAIGRQDSFFSFRFCWLDNPEFGLDIKRSLNEFNDFVYEYTYTVNSEEVKYESLFDNLKKVMDKLKEDPDLAYFIWNKLD